MELWQWHYRRVLTFYSAGKPRRDQEGWCLATADLPLKALRPLQGKTPAASEGKWLPLSPHRNWDECGGDVGWLAWEDDFDYADTLDGVLTGFGQHGWELVTLQTGTVDEYGWGVNYYVFKRPFDYETARLLEERLADTDSRPTFTHEEVMAEIRTWRA